jgi:hypothetical protein
MTTTYTTSSGIKKIGDGLEASTWGSSTNENWERVSSFLGDARSLNVVSMPLGSTDSATDGSTPAVWILNDSSDSGTSVSGEDGSEGRCAAVEFKNTGTLTGNITVEIRGASSGVSVNRVMVIRNGLSDSMDLIVDSAASTYTIKNGCYALIATRSASDGGVFVAGVHNLLSKLQVSDIVLPDATGEIEFLGNATITVEAADAASLVVSDGTTNIVTVDTTAASEQIVLGSSGARTLVDLSGGAATHSSRIIVERYKADALEFWDTNNSDVLVLDTTNGSPQVTVGATGSSVDLRVWGDIVVENQASEIKILAGDAAALNITEAANSYINVDTLAGEEQIEFVKQIEAPDIVLTGTDGYILGTPTSPVLSADKSTGYGIRNNAGTMEHKSSVGALAWDPIPAVIADILSGGGSGQAIAACTAFGTSGSLAKMGSFDIGPLRIIFNTLSVSGTDAHTLGTAAGTAATMDSTLYTVFICAETSSEFNNNPSAWVTDAGAGDFSLSCHGSTFDCTYVAIGDSGAV